MNDPTIKRVLMMMRTALAVGIDPLDVVEKAVTKNIIALSEVDDLMRLFEYMVAKEMDDSELSADDADVADLISGAESYLRQN